MKHNVGYYVSVRHELLLICTRGDGKPINRVLVDSVYSEEGTVHSREPFYFYDLLDKLYPDVLKVELFARDPPCRSGWAYWGDEISHLNPHDDS